MMMMMENGPSSLSSISSPSPLFKLGPAAPPVIQRVLLRKGWTEHVELKKSPSRSPSKESKPGRKAHKSGESGNDKSWSLFWRLDRFLPSEMESCLPHQRINHFPKSLEITRKDNLQRNLRKHKTLYGSVYSYFPESYSLPSEKKAVEQSFRENKQGGNNLWISKPRDLSRGRDIKVIKDLNSLNVQSSTVVQRYIDNPALLAGLDPLTVYLYEDGFVRLSTQKYSMANIDNLYCHLTNCSINKENPSLSESVIETAEEDANFGKAVTELLGQGEPPKWKLSQLMKHLSEKENVDVSLVWKKIKTIINLTILCLSNQNITAKVASSCFELFGFVDFKDILLDASMQPWLLEVNFSPSMGCDCAPDHDVKEAMISGLVDTLGVGVQANKSNFAAGKGGFEMIFPFSPKTRELAHAKNSMINIKGIVEEIKRESNQNARSMGK